MAIRMHAFRELWLHTGTACNLSCPFCHEGSQPGDTRLQALTLAQGAPVMQAAAAAGVQRFIFTGGEPLTAREILPLLSFALGLRPALVLTNGTAPLIRRTQQLVALAALPNPLSFRVSIDHPDEARHDAARGPRNFRKALQGAKLLREQGFDVSIACHGGGAHYDAAEVAARFARLLPRHGLPADLRIVPLPELGRPAQSASSPPGAPGAAPAPTQPFPCTDPQRIAAAACSSGRMLLRRDDRLRLQACPLTDDDARFDLGGDLAAALLAPVEPVHPRCGVCLRQGVNYSAV